MLGGATIKFNIDNQQLTLCLVGGMDSRKDREFGRRRDRSRIKPGLDVGRGGSY